MTPRERKLICKVSHAMMEEIALEASKLPPGSESAAIRSVFESPVKTRVLLKFLLQVDCFDFVNGYKSGGIYKAVAYALAHQYVAFEIQDRKWKAGRKV